MMTLDEWKKHIFEAITNVAGRDFQESAWFGRGEDVSSVEEVYCTLFDDFDFEGFLRTPDNRMSKEQMQLATTLRNRLNNFSEKIGDLSNPEDIFDHPDWAEIRRIANQLVQTEKL